MDIKPIQWGGCTPWIKELTAGANWKEEAGWVALSTPAEGTAELTSSAGDKKELKTEGGGLLAARQSPSTYTLSVEFFVWGLNPAPPIETVNGVTSKHYAVAIKSEDDNVAGLIIKDATVSLETSWGASEGVKWKYTFNALTPADGRDAVLIRPLREEKADSPTAKDYPAGGAPVVGG